MRPKLCKEMNIEDFKNYYWLKEELATFCKEVGIPSYGSKIELTERIMMFLTSGVIPKAHKKKSSKRKQYDPLSLDTVIISNHRCSQDIREFFTKEIGKKFHFSTYIQNFFKNNAGKTFKDVVKAWYEEEERKKDPSFTKELSPQFEYNQFIRDFYQDPTNKGKRRKDAIDAWNTIKTLPGDNKYKSSHVSIHKKE